jgi:uncharacterized membrane protein YphA (DoxX/SURF4 family)
MWALRIADGGYFVWRGFHKLVTPASLWMVPRVTVALPTTPLASIIRLWIFPHAEMIGLAIGVVELSAGLLLILRARWWVPALVLAGLNLLFFLTLGFEEPHDLELNLLMGILNLAMAQQAWLDSHPR